jgi:hypothetical protein
MAHNDKAAEAGRLLTIEEVGDILNGNFILQSTELDSDIPSTRKPQGPRRFPYQHRGVPPITHHAHRRARKTRRQFRYPRRLPTTITDQSVCQGHSRRLPDLEPQE